MALLSPGASRQSPLYHMAINSVALLCDSLTLSTVTCNPLQPNQPRMEGGVGDKERQRGREREGEKGWKKSEREKDSGSMRWTKSLKPKDWSSRVSLITHMLAGCISKERLFSSLSHFFLCVYMCVSVGRHMQRQSRASPHKYITAKPGHTYACVGMCSTAVQTNDAVMSSHHFSCVPCCK